MLFFDKQLNMVGLIVYSVEHYISGFYEPSILCICYDVFIPCMNLLRSWCQSLALEVYV
jgi:hypothetical protein